MTNSGVLPEAIVHFVVREAVPEDTGSIDEVTRAAFREHPFSQQTEHRIIRDLRGAGALSLSLVATIDGVVVGHVAFSPVTMDAQDLGWWGLGPVSVRPGRQRCGLGSALIRSGLRRLGERRVAGCVVLGDPDYYGRFGFAPHAGLVYPGAPAGHFMALPRDGTVPIGEVAYHPAFAQPGD